MYVRGEEMEGVVSLGRRACVPLCQSLSEDVSVATSAPPAPLIPGLPHTTHLPAPPRGFLPLVHPGILPPAACQSQRRKLGPLHRGRAESYQGYSPHQLFANL